MKTKLLLTLTSLFVFSSFGFQAQAAEPWKGKTEVRPIEVGILTGYSLHGTSTNWGVLGTGAYLLNDHGFA